MELYVFESAKQYRAHVCIVVQMKFEPHRLPHCPFNTAEGIPINLIHFIYEVMSYKRCNTHEILFHINDTVVSIGRRVLFEHFTAG
jgi:hypothetical protein